MIRCYWKAIIFFFLLFFLSYPIQIWACDSATATGFSYPIGNWDESCGFDVTCADAHHMGRDGVPLNGEVVGAEVLAPCTGVVEEAQSHNGYGGMVILECWTGSECVSPFMAHMFASNTVVDGIEYQGLQVSPGETVTIGDPIGYLADHDNNGGWDPHAHFGIRKDGYDSFNYSGCTNDSGNSVWSYAGYPGSDSNPDNCYDEIVADMYDPDDVIVNYPSTNTPGMTETGWNTNFSAVVFEAYERNGGYDALGDPFDDGGGTYLHEWDHGIYVQNFGIGDDVDEYAILTHADLLTDASANSASVIRHAFWYQYSHYDGVNLYGYPLADEMDKTRLTEEGWQIYDPECDQDADGLISVNESVNEAQDCIETHCLSSNYESFQRFEKGILCYESDTTSVTVKMASGTYSIASYTSPGASPSNTSTGAVDCDALAGSGSLTYCTEASGFDDCIQYSNNECSVTMNLAWLDDVNNIQWGAVEDENDAYVIGEYQIGWRALDANVIYYGVSDPVADCDETGCSTGTAYSSENSIATITAPGVASYENVLAYHVDETADCTFYCYVYFNAFEPKFNYDNIYVLNCYDNGDCNSGEYCNKSDSWDTWSCAAKLSDGQSCDSNSDCSSGYCDIAGGSNICYTLDRDGDGYYTYLDGGNDCDDAVSSVYPGATEVCGDGIDQNCDGSDLVCDDGGSDTMELSEYKFVASDADVEDYFSWSVATDGDVAVIGAYLDNDGPTDAGSVYVYRWNGSTWNSGNKLVASDATENSRYGSAVTINGDVIAVGAYQADTDSASNAGAVYVYQYQGDSWVKITDFTASDVAENDNFGWSIDSDENLIIVGSYGDDDNGSRSGSAYIYRWNGSRWNEEAKLTASDGAETDYFGYSVAIKGKLALVGAQGDDETYSEEGAAYVYRFDGTNWNQESKLTASDGIASDEFGESVSLSDDWAVVGSSGADNGGTNRGAVYVYRDDGTSWDETKLTASGAVDTDTLGSSVAIDENTIVAGSGSNDDLGLNAGMAIVFHWDGQNWNEEVTLHASDGSGSDYFGSAVAVSGHGALIGVYGDDDGGDYSGSAYFFRNIVIDTDGDGVSDADEETEGSNPGDAASTACVAPHTGSDWTITHDCKLFTAKTWTGNLYVQSGAVMTIPAGISLDLDFANKKLVVEHDSGVLIREGATLR